MLVLAEVGIQSQDDILLVASRDFEHRVELRNAPFVRPRLPRGVHGSQPLRRRRHHAHTDTRSHDCRDRINAVAMYIDVDLSCIRNAVLLSFLAGFD